MLEVIETYNRVHSLHFRILVPNVASESIEYECPKEFAAMHVTLFTWDSSDRVWVYSGDVGTYMWENLGSVWTEKRWVDMPGIDPPQALKQARPSVFTPGRE